MGTDFGPDVIYWAGVAAIMAGVVAFAGAAVAIAWPRPKRWALRVYAWLRGGGDRGNRS